MPLKQGQPWPIFLSFLKIKICYEQMAGHFPSLIVIYMLWSKTVSYSTIDCSNLLSSLCLEPPKPLFKPFNFSFSGKKKEAIFILMHALLEKETYSHSGSTNPLTLFKKKKIGFYFPVVLYFCLVFQFVSHEPRLNKLYFPFTMFVFHKSLFLLVISGFDSWQVGLLIISIFI